MGWPGINSDIPRKKIGNVNATLIQKRRLMSRSSVFSSASTLTCRGSSAMPQIGHAPGPLRTICGCIGHVYSTFFCGIDGRVMALGLTPIGFVRHLRLRRGAPNLESIRHFQGATTMHFTSLRDVSL